MALNLEALKHAKLKHVKDDDKHDGSSGLVEQEMDGTEAISKFQNTVLDVNLDQYYGLIEEDTFETEFISFSVADAKAFMRAHEHFQANSTLAGLAAADVQRLSGLESQLEEVMSRVKGDKEDGVFVKTTCRSAKDTAAFDSNFRKQYRASLASLKDSDENAQICALFMASIGSLKSHNAKEVIDTFSRSVSVYHDLELALQQPDRWDQQFVVRKWYHIHPSMEFRGFVCHGKLTAISQYNHAAFYPHLIAMKDALLTALERFFSVRIMPRLAGNKKFERYIVDFAICSDSPQTEGTWNLSKIKVIELNPFLYSTDPALFSWQKERPFLENGPLTFRLREKSGHGAKVLLAESWRKVMDEENAIK